MWYTVKQKGMVKVKETIMDLCRLPAIRECENFNLLEFSEYCAILEEKVQEIAKALPPENRQIIDAYISTRNDLEVEMVKAVFRWRKRK